MLESVPCKGQSAQPVEVRLKEVSVRLDSRVVQTAALLVLEPIFEVDFDEAAYGYRPRRSALDAVRTDERTPGRRPSRARPAAPNVAMVDVR